MTPKEVSKAGDVSDVDAVRPEPQSLSLVPLSAENSAADSAAMALPEPEMLAPGDPSHSSSCSNLSDTLMHCRHSKMQYSVLPAACVLSARQHHRTEPIHKVSRVL